MSRSGATQWRVACPHLDEQARAAETTMASQVSRNNVSYFPAEERVTDDVSVADLRRWLDRAEAEDRPLVVCNACRRVLLPGGDSAEVLHPGGWRGRDGVPGGAER